LALCHVLPVYHEMTTLFSDADQWAIHNWGQTETNLREVVEHKLTALLGTHPGEIFVEQGSAYAEVIRRASAWKADLIVVGHHSSSGLEHALLGSVAERVVRHAQCSVLIARSSQKSGVVLAATDLSDPSVPAIHAAAEQARRRNARLVVMSALDWSSAAWMAAAGAPFGIVPAVASAELQRETHDILLETLRLAMARQGIDGEARVVEDSPATAIVACAKELNAELVVVGTHGRTGLAHLALGSVAERVIQMTHCSVLAVRLHASKRSP